MTKVLNKNEHVSVETQKKPAEAANIPVQNAPTPNPQPQQSATTPPVVKKKGGGLRSLFVLILMLLFSCALISVGIIIGTYIVPSVNQWLIDHNFKEAPGTKGTRSEGNWFFFDQPNSDNDTKTESEIADVVEKVSGSVVSIAINDVSVNNRGVAPSTDKIGTGFLIDATGIIVTNQHVVRDTSAQYVVITSENKSLTPTKIIRDTFNDLAFVFVDPKDLNIKPISLGDSTKVRVGETVIAIGTPLGEFPGSVTTGVVSGVARTVRSSGEFWGSVKEYENVIQTDAAVNPGNSGGPLLNINGEVIGVNFATTSGADNISFAIPVSVVREKLSEYQEFGRFRNPYIGIGYRVITETEARSFDVKAGALVRSVVPNSPANNAGIRAGDIITSIDGQKVTSGVGEILQKLKIGQEVDFLIWRQSGDNGSEVTLKVKIGENQ
jgi:serine protease Do